jgi:DNA-binding response OmpR family regulator
MLSAKTETADKVSAPDTGADAYLTKPFEAEELKAQIRAVLRTAENRRQAIYDALTGLFNRRAFDDLVIRGLSARERYGQELSLVAIDIDHFKAVNGTLKRSTVLLAMTSETMYYALLLILIEIYAVQVTYLVVGVVKNLSFCSPKRA